MRKRKPLFFALGGVAALALILIVVLIASASTPEKTVESYLQALRDGDASRLVRLADPEYLESEAEKNEMSIKEYKDYFTQNFSGDFWEADFDWRIGDTTIEGDLAWVSGTVIVDEEDSADFQVPVIKRGKKWYIRFAGEQ